jgi:single-stranded DNA-binding protein
MTSTAKTKTNIPTVTIYGNVGGDPEEVSFGARTKTFRRYDPIIDDVVAREVELPAGSALRFSVARNYKEDGEDRTRWISVIDFQKLAQTQLVREGDLVKITGYFRDREGYDKKTGQTKTFRNFVLTGLHVEKRKVRHQAA